MWLCALCMLTVVAFVAPVAVAAQSLLTYRIVGDVEPFKSVNVAKRINVTLVHYSDIDKLPSAVASRLKKSKAAAARVGQGLPVCIVKAEPTVAKAVKCVSKDGTLDIYAEKFKYKRSQAIDVYVVCDSNLRSVSGASGSNITSRGCLQSPGLSLNAEFAMSIHVTVSAPSVSVVAKNSSDIGLTGSIGDLTAHLMSGSNLRMRKVTCATASITAEGESTAQVNATTSLTVYSSARSRVTYYAPGATLDLHSETLGEVYEVMVWENL